MSKASKEEIVKVIEQVVKSYGDLLQKIVVERDKEFNSQPFELALASLKQLLEETIQEEND